MTLLVVGSLALDSVETPYGKQEEVLGGSASFFSVCASYFCPVCIVGVVGDDFPKQHFDFLQQRNIATQGIQKRSGKTFRWRGCYEQNLNIAITLATELNVFADFSPSVPKIFSQSEYVVLGNIDPVLQLHVLKQIERPKLVACDTMNYWIKDHKQNLLKTLAHVDLLSVNDAEARLLAEEHNLVKAARAILRFGPKILTIKRGEHGVSLFTKDTVFSVPGYPLEHVVDPTGAGDAFAGGLMGFITQKKASSIEILRQGIVIGSVMASFTVEDFSLNRIKSLTFAQIRARFREFHDLTGFGANDLPAHSFGDVS